MLCALTLEAIYLFGRTDLEVPLLPCLSYPTYAVLIRPPLRFHSSSISWYPHDDAKTDAVKTLRRFFTVARRRPTTYGAGEPFAAAQDALILVALLRSLRIAGGTLAVTIPAVPVLAPLAHVAVHIMQAKGVWLEGADARGPFGPIRERHLLGVTIGTPDLRQLRRQRVAVAERRRCPRPAAVFPLGLRRQIEVFLEPLAQRAAKLHGIEPGDHFHGKLGCVLAGDFLLRRAVG